MSHIIRQDILADLGVIHFGRKIVQPASHEIREFYREAAKRLTFPLLRFDETQREVIAQSFAQAIAREKYTCWACAIMPDHVHLLIRKHRDQAEEMIAKLQAASRARLRDHGFGALDHPIWGGPGYKVFLDHPHDVQRVIPYIQANPPKSGLPAQRWDFVIPYNNWPLHAGHSTNSPYAKAMRAAGGSPLPK